MLDVIAHGDVVELRMNRPPANALNHELLEALLSAYEASIDDGAPLKLGNNKDYFQQWHWDGDGNLENGEPVGLELPGVGAGVHTVTVKKREATPVPPRLDVLCFTKDAVTPPLDSEVVAPE